MEMTYEEAIREIGEIRNSLDNVFSFSYEKKNEALLLAIEALEYKAKVKKHGSELAMAIAEYRKYDKKDGKENEQDG